MGFENQNKDSSSYSKEPKQTLDQHEENEDAPLDPEKSQESTKEGGEETSELEIDVAAKEETEEAKLEEIRDKITNIGENEIDRTEEKREDSASKTPKEILIELAGYCEEHMDAPIDAVSDGTFAGNGALEIEDGNVILYRCASDSEHLIKEGKGASAQEMRDSSEFHGGAPLAGTVHTTADADMNFSHYPIRGTFKIPVADFLKLGKEGKIIIGNLGEAEIVMSGDIAAEYLDKEEENPEHTPQPKQEGIPDSIDIDL